MTFKILIFLLSFVGLYGQEKPLGTVMKGKMSYYAFKFEGRKTANGEVLRNGNFTCAHRTLPFGTMLEIENPRNGRWVVVRVNDRGPFSGSRIVDLSYSAAKRIGMINSGVVSATAMVVGYHGEVSLKREESEIFDNEVGTLPFYMEPTVEIPKKLKPKKKTKKKKSKTAKKKKKK